ncbi:vWA domain-containing protein [Aestuariibius insulae]|uniref:vWA domain-containing protein n=1 Tax=Aestuariibius insulae TaxID=2058287 RepID=UPI00345E43E0
MSDDFEKLKSALQRTSDKPGTEAKGAAMRLAMEEFDRLQESQTEARLNSDPPQGAAGQTGIWHMVSNFLSSRAALAATGSIAALTVGVVVVTPLMNDRSLTGSDRLTGEVELTPSVAATESAPVAPEVSPSAVPEPPMPPVPTPMVTPGEDPAPEADQEVLHSVAPRAIAPQSAPPALSTEPVLEETENFALSAEPSGQSRRDLIARSLERDATASEGMTGLTVRPERMLEDIEITQRHIGQSGDTFPEFEPSVMKTVLEAPVSTFSVEVDTASYGIVRSSLMAGVLPPEGAVRIEEIINYFPYDYPAPSVGEAPFRPSVTVLETPWNEGTQLVHIGLQGQILEADARPPLNLVLLIDTSGSMDQPNKLPLLKQALPLMLDRLRPEDEIAIVAYAGNAGVVLEPTRAEARAQILTALDGLQPRGGTAGQAGLEQAYALAAQMSEEGDVSRILLATDGDFNVGPSDPGALARYVGERRGEGTYLSVLGFGRGNLDDATMQALAQNGNGTAAYIDTVAEAQKVLVEQLTGALFPIADDVKVQVEFNPAVVQEYRLLGYETRGLARQDFNNDAVDAGEIGSGHTVTAIYEVTPVGSPAIRNEPLRYGAEESAETVVSGPRDELGYLKLRYKAPGAAQSALLEMPIPAAPQEASEDVRFAVAIAGFGQLLTEARYLGDWGWEEAIALAQGARGEDPFGYRAEAVRLMRIGQSLSDAR